jgi:hypothetical protein
MEVLELLAIRSAEQYILKQLVIAGWNKGGGSATSRLHPCGQSKPTLSHQGKWNKMNKKETLLVLASTNPASLNLRRAPNKLHFQQIKAHLSPQLRKIYSTLHAKIAAWIHVAICAAKGVIANILRWCEAESSHREKCLTRQI